MNSTITIRLFRAGRTTPRLIGTLTVQPVPALALTEDLDTEDLKLLWDVERAINEHIAGRCHIEVTE